VQIKVNMMAPSNLAYPQTTTTASFGRAITPDIPSLSGSASSFIISPALPAG
jgi:hypothetical protein